MGSEVLQYQVSTERAPSALWELSHAAEPQQLSFSQEGSTLSFLYQNEDPDRLPEFALFSDSDVQRPHYFRAVANQSPPQRADMLIVSAESLLSEARRLAEFHREHDGMQVEVISTQQLYLEASAGRPDPTAIRNYTHRLYSTGQLKHLLLFGAASFDYKQILERTATHVPTYQSESSLNPTTTYGSDDYFGFLEQSEGRWLESPAEDHTIDIGIGRLPARRA